MALTDAKLRKLANKKDDPITLSHRDGLRVKRNKNGSVLWQYRCRYLCKPVIMSLGYYPEVSLKDAQDLIPHLKHWLSIGEDPRKAYKAYSKGAADDPTASELAQKWLNNTLHTYKPKTQEVYSHHMGKWVLPYLKDKPACEMTAADWHKYFDYIRENGTAKTASVILVRVKTVLRWAAMRGELPNNNPIFNLQTKHVGESATQGQRWLPFNELALLWRKIEQARAAPANKACLQLVFLTGARQSEIRELKWEHIDEENKIWTVPPENSKTNKPIRRPITKKMQEILDSLALVYGKKGYICPGSSPRKAITTHAVNRFCARIWGYLHEEHKTAKFVPHDARRSISTLLSELDIPPHVTEKMLGHAMRGVMAVYNKHDYIKAQAEGYELYWKKINEAIANLKS
jgi:integrase